MQRNGFEKRDLREEFSKKQKSFTHNNTVLSQQNLFGSSDKTNDILHYTYY